MPSSRKLPRLAAAAAGVIGAALLIPAAPAQAANNPTYRDCSLLVGVDPDFLQLSGVKVTPAGSLTVPRSGAKVQLLASESSDPGDNAGHVTLQATITARNAPTVTVSGAATGRVVLPIALPRPAVGRTYTISWAATFDNGFHACPSILTVANLPFTPHPFVVTVQGH